MKIYRHKKNPNDFIMTTKDRTYYVHEKGWSKWWLRRRLSDSVLEKMNYIPSSKLALLVMHNITTEMVIENIQI